MISSIYPFSKENLYIKKVQSYTFRNIFIEDSPSGPQHR